MSQAIAYWCPGVAPTAAYESPQFARILLAGPWHFVPHPQGGTLAVWADFPAKGQQASRLVDSYAAPVDCGDGLHFLGPKGKVDLYDYARDDRTGTDLRLVCGKTVSIPCAVIQHRQFKAAPGAGRRLGGPVTEYGALAVRLLERAEKENVLGEEDPELARLIALAFAQCYRVTPELLDAAHCFALDDVDPLLGVIWWGDPKALSPAPAVAAPDSQSSGSLTSNSPQATPSAS